LEKLPPNKASFVGDGWKGERPKAQAVGTDSYGQEAHENEKQSPKTVKLAIRPNQKGKKTQGGRKRDKGVG